MAKFWNVNMDVKLEKYEPNFDTSKPKILGWAKVVLNDKMFVWMTVIQGKNGAFMKFPSVGVNREFMPALGWLENNIEEKIRESVMPTLKEKYFQMSPF